MTESQIRRLLDDGVPPIPDRLWQAPTRELVRRGRRRRRRAVLATTTAGLLFAIGGVAAVQQYARPDSASTPATTPTAAPALPGEPWHWVMARLDRDDRRLTIWPAGIDDCYSVYIVDTLVSETATEVTVVVRATVRPASECATAGAPNTETVELAAPLGDRVLRDGFDLSLPTLYRDRELPLLAEHGWEEVPGEIHRPKGDFWAISYQRADPPSIDITVQPTALARQPSESSVGTAPVGARRGTIYPSLGGISYEIRWTVDDLTYVLMANPNEGDTVSLDQFRSLVAGLEWE